MGKTIIHCNGTTYVGDFDKSYVFKLFGHEFGRETAHEKVVNAAGLDISQCVAGSIDQNGSTWTINSNSSSVNKVNGLGSSVSDRHAHGNRLGPAKRHLEAGTYTMVSSEGVLSVYSKGKKYTF